MSSPVIELFIICSKSKKLFNPLGKVIEKEEGLGFSHFSIAIAYEGAIVVSEAVYPRPRFISLEDWSKLNEPVFMFRKEVKNQNLMFQMMAWMAITCTTASYSLSQLILIYIGKVFPKLKDWSASVKLNHEHGLICSEYIIRFLNKFFGLEITKSEDSIGLKDPFEALGNSWVLQDPIQMVVIMDVYIRQAKTLKDHALLSDG